MAGTDPTKGMTPAKQGATGGSGTPSGAPNLGIAAPPAAQSTVPGLNAAELALNVTVPVAFGSSQMTTMTVGQYLQSYLTPDHLLGYVPQLVAAGYLTSNPGPSGHYNPTEVQTKLGQALIDASTHNMTLIDLLNAKAGASGGTAPGGSTRFFKGGTAEVGLTSAGAVQAQVDPIAQNLIGRRLRPDEVTAITAILNGQEYQKGAADVATAQAQQAAYLEAIQQGSEGGGAGAAASGPPVTVNMTGTGESALQALGGWKAQALQQLAGTNQLSGVDPNVIAAIAMAESSGQGGAINSQGYGGWFGLGQTASYPAGASSAELLKGTDQASFTRQAILAASDFAPLLARFNGDLYLAETAYQQGPNADAVKNNQPGGEGVDVFKKYNIPQQATHPAHDTGGLTQEPGVTATQGQAPPAPTQGVSAATTGGYGGPGGATNNAIPALPQIPAGSAASVTVGNAVPFQTPTGTDYVLPPHATIVTNPETAAEAGADYLKNHLSAEYQANNLLNTFQALQKALGGGANTPGPATAPQTAAAL